MNELFERSMAAARRGATHSVVAPAGPLGLAFETTRIASVGVVIASVAPDSPIVDFVGAGWLLTEVGGTAVVAGDAAGAGELLRKREAAEARALKLLNPHAEQRLLASLHEAWRTTEQLHVTVDAPPGALGIVLGKDGDGRTIVFGLRSDSPLLGSAGVGWALRTIDGVDVSRLPHEAAGKLLADGHANPRRRIVLDADPQKAPPRFLLVPLLLGLGVSLACAWRSSPPWVVAWLVG